MKMGLKWVFSVVLFWGLCGLEASRWDERWRPSTCQDSRTRSLRQRPQCDETQLAPKNKKEKKILPVWYLLQHASTSSSSRRVSVVFLLTGVASDALAQLWAFGENDIPPASFCCLEVRWGWQAFFFFWWGTAPTSSGGALHFTGGSQKLWSGAAAYKGADMERLEAGEVNRCHLSLGRSGSPRTSSPASERFTMRLLFSRLGATANFGLVSRSSAWWVVVVDAEKWRSRDKVSVRLSHIAN